MRNKSNKPCFSNGFFIQFWWETDVFQHSFGKWILMQNSVLERLLVVDYMTDIWIWNLQNFVLKLVSEVENCYKKKVGPVTTFSWITLKFQIISYDKNTFFESLGCKIIEIFRISPVLGDFRVIRYLYSKVKLKGLIVKMNYFTESH